VERDRGGERKETRGNPFRKFLDLPVAGTVLNSVFIVTHARHRFIVKCAAAERHVLIALILFTTRIDEFQPTKKYTVQLLRD